MYYQGQAPAAEPERPGVLMAGVMTVFGTVVLTLGTTLSLVLSYQWVTKQMPQESTSDEQFASYLESNMIVVIAFYAVISLVLAVGAIMTMRQQNAGRIMVWIGGGVLTAVNLCCGLVFAAVVTAISDYTSSSSSYSSSSAPADAPTTELTLATIFTFAAVVAAIVAMILLAQRSVGLWIKGTPQVMPGGYAVPGAPMPGSPIAYQQPQQPYQAPPPQPPQQQYPPPQYGPGSYGDQYGPGQQQPYNGGDQYGPGNPTSGPPNQGW